MNTLFLLVAAHALCDYPLQGDFIAKHKSPWGGGPPDSLWFHCLAAHTAIHAGAVLLITGSLAMACVELVAHFLIDLAKCRGWTSLTMDQLLHVACKVAYVVALSPTASALVREGGGGTC